VVTWILFLCILGIDGLLMTIDIWHYFCQVASGIRHFSITYYSSPKHICLFSQ
jgi:hypothetical protein